MTKTSNISYKIYSSFPAKVALCQFWGKSAIQYKLKYFFSFQCKFLQKPWLYPYSIPMFTCSIPQMRKQRNGTHTDTGFQLPLAAHLSASGLATGRHCALYIFTYLLTYLLTKIYSWHHSPLSCVQCDRARLHVLTASRTTSYTGRQETSFVVAPSGESGTETASDLC